MLRVDSVFEGYWMHDGHITPWRRGGDLEMWRGINDCFLTALTVTINVPGCHS